MKKAINSFNKSSPWKKRWQEREPLAWLWHGFETWRKGNAWRRSDLSGNGDALI